MNFAQMTASQVESLFEELIAQQHAKMLQYARNHIPHLTFEDILNPHDYPKLMADPVFNYEEGLAAGLMAAQFAMRARVLRPLQGEWEKYLASQATGSAP
jgi:hypothetical protein